MSTRCQIGFYETKESKLSAPEALIYRHGDGYPEGVIPDIVPILKEFHVGRGLSDIEYASAWLVAKLKTDFLNIGICKEYHSDIEYYYAVHKDGTIIVYDVSGKKFTPLFECNVEDKEITYKGEVIYKAI